MLGVFDGDDVREHGRALVELYLLAEPGRRAVDTADDDTAVSDLLASSTRLRLLNWAELRTERHAGAECRTIVGAASGRLAGARVLAGLPMRLAVGDDSVAVLAPVPDGAVTGPPLVVRPSGLLDALVAVFDILWWLAVPAVPELDEKDRAILALMYTGATDEEIARGLSMSRRTVVRRVSALLLRLGAVNRFQAGVWAARLGWL